MTSATLVREFPCQPAVGDSEKIAHGRAVLEAIKPRYTATNLGYAFRALLGRPVDELQLSHEKDRSNVARWLVKSTFAQRLETAHASHASPAVLFPSAGDAWDTGHDLGRWVNVGTSPEPRKSSKSLTRVSETLELTVSEPIVTPIQPMAPKALEAFGIHAMSEGLGNDAAQ